jgi:Transient receptor potential (TRP) ion channel
LLVIEIILLLAISVKRPYDGRAANIINIMISIIKILSFTCVFLFVDQLGSYAIPGFVSNIINLSLGMKQTTKTVTGIVLIVIQSTLTLVLAILVVSNFLLTCFRGRKQSSDSESMQGDVGSGDESDQLDERGTLSNQTPFPPKIDGTTFQGQPNESPSPGSDLEDPLEYFPTSDYSDPFLSRVNETETQNRERESRSEASSLGGSQSFNFPPTEFSPPLSLSTLQPRIAQKFRERRNYI